MNSLAGVPYSTLILISAEESKKGPWEGNQLPVDRSVKWFFFLVVTWSATWTLFFQSMNQ